MLNQKFSLEGHYYKDTDHRVRLQLKLKGLGDTGSTMLQVSAGAAGLPFTIACNATCPLVGMVAADGEIATVTLLGSKLLPPPQPTVTINRTSSVTQRARDRFITVLDQKIVIFS